jgi:hypothetical protein
MVPRAPAESRRRTTHPALVAAAVAVTAFAVVGIAAMLGWLPDTRGKAATPVGFAAPGQQVSGGVATEYAVAPAPERKAAPAQPVALPPTAAEAKKAFETKGRRLEGRVSPQS